MSYVRSCWALLCLLSLSATAAPARAEGTDTTLIRVKHLYTMNGSVMENAEVLVRNGRIVGIGDQIRPEGEFDVLEVDTLIPGLVDASTTAGLRGGSAEATREVTPEFETAISIDWSARDFREAIASGVTAVNIMPATDNVFCGFSCLAKTAGDDLSLDITNRRIVAPRCGLAIAMCSDPTGGNSSRSRPDSIYVRLPTNRMGVVWIIRNRLQQVRDKQFRGEIDPRVVAPLEELLSGKVPAFGISRTAYDIETWIRLADDYKIAPIIFGGHEAYQLADVLQSRQIPVVYTASTTGSSVGEERTALFWNTPGMLDNKGVPVTLAGGDLLTQARFAARFGMNPDSALAAVTTRPAKLLGAENRLGKIAANYDADFVALDGPPLEFTTNIQWVMVDGQVHNIENGK